MNTEAAKRIIEFDAGFSMQDLNVDVRKQSGVYCLYCTATEIAYIGATGDCKTRIQKHFQRLRIGNHPCTRMLDDFKKHTESCFIAFVIEYCDADMLSPIEIKWINLFGGARTYNKNGIEMSHEHEDNHETAMTLSNTLGVKLDTFRVAWNRCGLTGFNKHRALTEVEVRTMIDLYANKQPNTKNMKRVLRQKGEAPKEAPAPPYASVRQEIHAYNGVGVRKFFTEAILCSIVIGHAGLIWYDMHAQWHTPGAIGGGLSFLIVMAALLLASDKSRVRTSDGAVMFIALVDALAVFVHYPTFMLDPSMGETQTWVLSVFLASVSWVALYLFRDYNQD